MYWVIKNNEIVCFTTIKPTINKIEFDLYIEGDFDMKKKYVYYNWHIITLDDMKKIELWATVDENGEVEISDLIKNKIRLQEIKNILDAYKEEYRDLEDAGTGRSIKEQEKYEYLTVEKEGLLAERKKILDSIES